MPDVTYVSWDPGKTTGYALWDDTGQLMSKGKCGIDTLHFILQSAEILDTIQVFIVEDFRLFKHMAHKLVGSRFEVARALGAIEYVASKKKIQVVYQSPATHLYSGLKYIGAYYPKGTHVPDDIAAQAHGELYLVTNNIKKHRIIKEH